ncbi:hypothetical protein ACJX0J_011646, partial [Zea mays]
YSREVESEILLHDYLIIYMNALYVASIFSFPPIKHTKRTFGHLIASIIGLKDNKAPYFDMWLHSELFLIFIDHQPISKNLTGKFS